MSLKNLKELRKNEKLNQHDMADRISISYESYSEYENEKRAIPSDILIRLSKYFNVSTDYILDLSDCRSVDNDYISKETGLSDSAINRLTEHKRNAKKYKQDDDFPKLILTGINKLLEHRYGSSVLFWIGMYLDTSRFTGYLSKGKQIPFEENRKGKQNQIIHNDLFVYDELSDKQLLIDNDVIHTAIFDKIRNSLFAVEKE